MYPFALEAFKGRGDAVESPGSQPTAPLTSNKTYLISTSLLSFARLGDSLVTLDDSMELRFNDLSGATLFTLLQGLSNTEDDFH